LKVVVALGLDREQGNNLKVIVQRANGRTCRFARVVPPFKGNNQNAA
jgi:hypothetical protein